MCSAGGAQAGMQVFQGAMSAQGAMAQGKQESKYYSYLADRNQKEMDSIDTANAEQVRSIRFSEGQAVDDSSKQYAELGATQKAAMAANGIYSDSGTSQDIAEDNSHKQALDEAAIRYNSQNSIIEQGRAAISAKNQLSAEMASNQMKSSNAKQAAKLNAMNSLVGGAASAGSSYMASSKYSNSGSGLSRSQSEGRAAESSYRFPKK